MTGVPLFTKSLVIIVSSRKEIESPPHILFCTAGRELERRRKSQGRIGIYYT